MRITVTVRDELYDEADRAAARLGVSRSKLVQDALERYLKVLREQSLAEELDEHIKRHGQPIDAGFERYVRRVWAQDMGDDEW